VAFIKIRLLVETKCHISIILSVAEEADDLADLAISRHPIPGSWRERWCTVCDDDMKPLPMERYGCGISAIFASTALSPLVLSADELVFCLLGIDSFVVSIISHPLISMLKQNGEFDNKFVLSTNTESFEWAKDLFECYLKDSTQVTHLGVS